ncbi:Arc family DNA-binding protein [Acetobacter fabarum]|uniref:Arc family DNA-binding protein n=1 Tax=Acetobacter fabarum TaxID=483199 RepID=UPI0039EBC562
MARDDPMMRFRAPADLKALIEEAAAKNGRSLNAEIVHRLERSLEDEAIESDSLDMTLRASELYKNAYDLHNLILRTHDDILKSTLAKTRDELIRQFEQIMQKSGYSDKIGKYPWE